MTRPLQISPLVLAGLIATMPLFFCSDETPTGTSPQHDEGATIYLPGGTIPADSVVVKFFLAGTFDAYPVSVAVTDSAGWFTVNDLDDGIYSMIVENDSLILFEDSVPVASGIALLHDGTLACAGTYTGIAALLPCDDPRTVTVRAAGTGRQLTVNDTGGRFTLAGMAEGVYTLHLTSTRPQYLPTTVRISVAACTTNAATDTLRIIYTGIPEVTGIGITEDTAAGIIRLSWNASPYADFRDYVLFKDTGSTGKALTSLFRATRDTIWIDTGFRSLRPDPSDTALRRCRYRIAIRDNALRIGPTARTTEFSFVPKSQVTTFFTHKILNRSPGSPRCRPGDTLHIALTARNPVRQLRTLVWYDPVRGDTLMSDSSNVASGTEISGSIRFSFGTAGTGTDALLAIVTDREGVSWTDSISLRTINDFPEVRAGNDTCVFIGETVPLHGATVNRIGFLSGWEWKIGAGNWGPAGPDISVKAPPFEETLVCSLAVTDDYGNRGVTAVHIFTTLPVQAVAASGEHSLILKTDGGLWGCGENSDGRLGDTTSPLSTLPIRMLTDVQQMDAGYDFNLILRTDGTLWACGHNYSGQFGIGPTEENVLPRQIMTGVRAFAAGNNHSFVIRTDNSLWASGLNESGQFGDGTYQSRNTFVAIMEDVKKVAAGAQHTLILKIDGSLWACGSNEGGQLGDGTRKPRSRPVFVMSEVRAVAAGDVHTLILKNDSTLWACGINTSGQLGDGTTNDRLFPVQVLRDVIKIAAGSNHSLVVTAGDTAWGFGNGSSGQLGPSGSITTFSPELLMTDVNEISAGSNFSLFLKNDGTLWGCGENNRGQLGDGSSGINWRQNMIRVIPAERVNWW